MSDIDTKDVIKRHPNSVFLTTATTGLESFASIIKDPTWHKAVTILIPILVGGGSFVIRRLVKHVECKRGISTYKTFITELEAELQVPNLTKAKKQQIVK